MVARLPANDGDASDERIEAAELYIFGLPSSRVLRGPEIKVRVRWDTYLTHSTRFES